MGMIAIDQFDQEPFDDGLRMPGFDPEGRNLRSEIEYEIELVACRCAAEGRKPSKAEIVGVIGLDRYSRETQANRRASPETVLSIAADVMKVFEPPKPVNGMPIGKGSSAKRVVPPSRTTARAISKTVRREVSKVARALLRSSRPGTRRNPSRMTARPRSRRSPARPATSRTSDPPAPAAPTPSPPKISITRVPATDAQVRRWLDAICRFLLDGESSSRGDS